MRLLLAVLLSLAVGERVPAVALPSTDGKNVSPSDFVDRKPVLVAFFPAVFSPACTAQLKGYREQLPKFVESSVQILAISTDSPFAQKAFAEAYKLPFPLLSDQGQEAMKAFGVSASREFYATRSVFLFDKSGFLAYVDRAYEVGKSEPTLLEAVAALR